MSKANKRLSSAVIDLTIDDNLLSIHRVTGIYPDTVMKDEVWNDLSQEDRAAIWRHIKSILDILSAPRNTGEET